MKGFLFFFEGGSLDREGQDGQDFLLSFCEDVSIICVKTRSGGFIMSTLPVRAGASAYVAEGDSTFFKALSYVPLVGLIVSTFQDWSLEQRADEMCASQASEAGHLVALIEVKNQYKVANVVRSLLTIALLVVGVAFDIIVCPLGWGILLSIILVGRLFWNACAIRKNNELIRELKETGFRAGMRVR